MIEPPPPPRTWYSQPLRSPQTSLPIRTDGARGRLCGLLARCLLALARLQLRAVVSACLDIRISSATRFIPASVAGPHARLFTTTTVRETARRRRVSERTSSASSPLLVAPSRSAVIRSLSSASHALERSSRKKTCRRVIGVS